MIFLKKESTQNRLCSICMNSTLIRRSLAVYLTHDKLALATRWSQLIETFSISPSSTQSVYSCAITSDLYSYLDNLISLKGRGSELHFFFLNRLIFRKRWNVLLKNLKSKALKVVRRILISSIFELLELNGFDVSLPELHLVQIGFILFRLTGHEIPNID